MKSYKLKLVATTASLALLAGCDGSSGSGRNDPDLASGAALQSLHYGRLVDVYAYRRVDPVRADRRDVLHRRPVLIERNVVVRPDLETDPLFDATGNARLDAHYRFLPFDVTVGHEELLILWDDQIPPEKANFEMALASATSSLPVVPASFHGQNTGQRPIPVLPRNAALKLSFSHPLGVGSDFFKSNPDAIQLLEFISPAASKGQAAFRPLPSRFLVKGSELIIDTSLIGGEAEGGRTTDGLPPSRDNRTANIRLALPTSGVVSKQIKFAEDPIPELNGQDSTGAPAVIRDFRSGNLADGEVGALADAEAPVVVGHMRMGITAIDVQNSVITVNKRNRDVAIRGRIPYVDGALDPVTGLALGPAGHPLQHELRGGDVIMQTVISPFTAEPITVRAEVLMNLDVGNTIDEPEFEGLGMFRKGSPQGQPGDGGQDPFARLKVANLSVRDAAGNDVSFRASSLPLGEDCTVRVHYYENVPYRLAHAKPVLSAVSDRARVHFFLVIDPEPPVLDANRNVNFGHLVSPDASIALRFSEPMNLESVGKYENFMLTNETFNDGNILQMLTEPKPSGLAMLGTNLLDQSGDGTLLQLRPPLGHTHVANAPQEEKYWFHMILGASAPTDMSGNPVDVFDRTSSPIEALSIPYYLDQQAQENQVASRVFRFANQDEDGSAPNTNDFFGQFQLIDGGLQGARSTRFSAVADLQILQGVTRFERGECDIAGPAIAPFPPGGIPGILYQCPSMVRVQPFPPLAFQPPPGPQIGGGVSEPHNERGSRLQMTYREDDFGLGYRDENRYLLDIEQMHWAPFNDQAVRFDVFDRYTLRLAHSDWRPDLAFGVANDLCVHDCFSGRSGLRPTFDENLLSGTGYETVVKDAKYEMNPNDAFRASTGTKFVPYPKFQKSYTWRDSRLIDWDAASQTATGFGGAHQPVAPVAIRDATVSCSSPYVPDKPKAPFGPLHASTDFVYDYGDFFGHGTLDHDPIALPLLLDFNVFPDGPANGGFALGTNQMHIALVGPCWSPISPGGYYSGTPLAGCGGIPWPEMRAHVSGGIDRITRADILVEPETSTTASISIIKDLFYGDATLGLSPAPPLDDHVHWAQADFVRRVSMVTYGFWDTLRPNAHDFNHAGNSLETTWPGKSNANGFPNFSADPQLLGASDFVTLLDPPLSEQPVGTQVVVEYRGATGFDNDQVIYSAPDELSTTVNWSSVDIVKKRGNLLNPFYACEAYRYALPHEFVATYQAEHTANWPAGGLRVEAEGLTDYVTEDRLAEIRLPNGLLPRYLNFRIVMENNLTSNPPISPRVDSFTIVYRVGRDN